MARMAPEVRGFNRGGRGGRRGVTEIEDGGDFPEDAMVKEMMVAAWGWIVRSKLHNAMIGSTTITGRNPLLYAAKLRSGMKSLHQQVPGPGPLGFCLPQPP